MAMAAAGGGGVESLDEVEMEKKWRRRFLVFPSLLIWNADQSFSPRLKPRSESLTVFTAQRFSLWTVRHLGADIIATVPHFKVSEFSREFSCVDSSASRSKEEFVASNQTTSLDSSVPCFWRKSNRSTRGEVAITWDAFRPSEEI